VINQIASKIGNSSKPGLEAYRVARKQDETYVTNPNFTIGFLRAEHYDVKKAAWRMFRHLKIKRELFGDEKLARDILLDDLGEEGKKYMALGTLQVLPMPDDDGRRVIFGTTVLDSSASEIQKEAAIKVYFYFLAYAIEHVDDSIQKKGIVLLNWRVHNPPFPNAALLGPVSQIWRCIPMRVVAVHTCYAPITAITFSAFQLFGKLVAAWSSNQLVINHSHCGTATEVEYELRTKHNIPTDRFPYNKQAADIIHNHYHKVWMNRRNAIDQKKAQLYVSSRRSSVSVTQVLQSLRTSDQSIGIDFWNDSIGFSMVSDDESMIGSYHTNGDSNNEECMNISISSNDTFGDGSLESTENMFVGNDSCALGNGQLVNESDSDDIKLGRGKALQRHPGNIWLKALVSKEYEKYDSLDRNEQTKYATALVTKIKGTGRRFLKKSGETWTEVNDLEARKRVASRFRDERKRRLERSKT